MLFEGKNREKEVVVVIKRIWASVCVTVAAGILFCLSACGNGKTTTVENLTRDVQARANIQKKSTNCRGVTYDNALDFIRERNPNDSVEIQNLDAEAQFAQNCRSKGYCHVNDLSCVLSCEEINSVDDKGESESICADYGSTCKNKTKKKCKKKNVFGRCIKHKKVFDKCVQK